MVTNTKHQIQKLWEDLCTLGSVQDMRDFAILQEGWAGGWYTVADDDAWKHLKICLNSVHCCVTRAPLLYFIRSWEHYLSKLWVSESVSQWGIGNTSPLSRSPLCAIYEGMHAFYWPSTTNHQLLPPHSVLYCQYYWPSTNWIYWHICDKYIYIFIDNR